MGRYKVTCKQCKRSDIITIDDAKHQVLFYDRMINTPILASRFRGDLQWGFECVCGNYDMLAEQEKGNFNNLVSGTPNRIAEIAAILKSPVTHRFKMEPI